jgi:hypothetical protein
MLSGDDVSAPVDAVVPMFFNLYTAIALDPGSDIPAHLLSNVFTYRQTMDCYEKIRKRGIARSEGSSDKRTL